MDQQQQSRWRPTRGQLLWSGVAVALLTIAILIGYRYGITLWDWIKLLVVPAVIAAGGFWFNRQQRERELEIAERRTQDEALQAYLDQMSSMLIPSTEQPSLYKARPGDSLSSVARARTLTVLPRLDAARKRDVMQFLYESRLIAKDRPVLDLRDANLTDADLRGATLMGATLSGANIDEAHLSEAFLDGTNLSNAYLHGADLADARLLRADLFQAKLSHAHLTRADLSSAILDSTDLRDADLSHATLFNVDLGNADLRGADLADADLTDAWITEEQLQQVKSLEGATMPNGQKYEEWLKSREGDGG